MRSLIVPAIAGLLLTVPADAGSSAHPASDAPANARSAPVTRDTPVVDILTSKIQSRITWWTLTRRGLLVRTRSDIPVTLKASIGIVRPGKGFRQIASADATQAANVHRLRLRPTVRAAGKRRGFCLRYRVAARAADGSGASGSGCVRVVAGRAPRR
jgi:hypothetical protein